MKFSTSLLAAAAAAALCAGNLSAQTFNSGFEKLYDPGAKMVKENATLLYNGPVSPIWKDASSFVYKNHEAAGDKYYMVNLSDASKKEISSSEYEALAGDRDRMRPPFEEFRGGEREASASPDGALEAVIRDSNVWIRKAGDKSGEKQLTFDGTDADAYAYVVWSPDSKKLAAFRQEVITERQIMLRESRPESQVQPIYRWINYAKPGDKLAQVTPELYNVESMSRIEFDTSAYGNQYSLSFGQWAPDSSWFTFEYNKRGHQLYQLVKVDAATGENKVIAEEKTNTFVYYNELYRYYFADGKRLLWVSERDDWRHLYMVDTETGKATQLTKGQWNVREIHYVDEEGGYVLMNANGYGTNKGEDPYNKHLLRLDLASGKIDDLTPENANHTVSFSSDHKYFVDSYSRPDYAGASVARRSSDGSKVMDIHTADIKALLDKGFTMPIVFSAKGRDGKTDIWGTMYLPYNFDKSKKYPVVEYIYAGPHDSHVVKNFGVYTRNSMLQELGFVVVTIDGMGTDNRSKSFQDVCYKNLKDAGFPDRILWMKAAAKKYNWLDISNVGIYGYSAGGQNTLSALLFFPDFYKVGVALCGCHDNRMDKMWWNEQWMGWPIGPEYSENSNVDNAGNLQGKLLIVNGEMDDNVDPASTLQVVYELVKNNKYFEQMYLPGHTHNLGSDYISKRIFEFFYRNIKGE